MYQIQVVSQVYHLDCCYFLLLQPRLLGYSQRQADIHHRLHGPLSTNEDARWVCLKTPSTHVQRSGPLLCLEFPFLRDKTHIFQAFTPAERLHSQQRTLPTCQVPKRNCTMSMEANPSIGKTFQNKHPNLLHVHLYRGTNDVLTGAWRN